MSVFSQFFNQARGVTDPRQLPRFDGLGNNTASGGIAFGGQGEKYPGNSNFWTDAQYGYGSSGAQDDTNWTGGTYKTIVNLSGAGWMFGCIGPCIANGADLTYFRITRDGYQWPVISWAPGTINYRAGLGYVLNDSSATANALMTPTPLGNTNSVFKIGAYTVYTLVPNPLVDLIGGGLRFEASLLVEMKVDTNQTGTGSQERRSGVLYRLQ